MPRGELDTVNSTKSEGITWQMVVWFIVTLIITSWLGIMLGHFSPVLSALILIASFCIWVVIFINRYFSKSKQEGQRSLIVFLLGAVFWSPLIKTFTPPTSIIVYKELTDSIVPTPDPDYKSGERKYANALLVEFQSRSALVDIRLNTDNEYKTYEAHIGKPNQRTILPTDEMIIDARRGMITIGATQVTASQQPNSLEYRSSSEMVTGTASLYIYLEGDRPLKVTGAIFNGKTFALSGDKLVEVTK